MNIFKLGFIGLVFAIPLFFIYSRSFFWSIEQTIKSDLTIIEKYILEAKILNFHPLVKKIVPLSAISNTINRFQLTEELEILGGLHKEVIVSEITIESKGNSKYILLANLKLLGFFRVKFESEFILTRTNAGINVKEKVNVSGSLLPAFITYYLAGPCHITMLEMFKSELEKK